MPHPSRKVYVQRMKDKKAKELKAKREKQAKGINWRDS